MSKFVMTSVALVVLLVAFEAPKCRAVTGQQPAEAEVAQAAPEQQDESYQRVYEAFTKLLQNVTNNSLANARRLVSRLNRLVGTPAEQPAQSIDERTDQILNRLDRVDQSTDQGTLVKLNEDVGRLISTLNNSYLRNIRRVIERVNKVVGGSTGQAQAASVQQPMMNRQFSGGNQVDDPALKQPGFPGFDEILVVVDRIQKSFAHFVRSSTRLITSG